MSDATRIIDHAKSSIASFYQWMTEKVEPIAKSLYPLELSTWFKELDLIRALVERPDRIRIALIGTTGAGKSTFLNAVLGQEILPVGVMQPCTAFVTSVVHSQNLNYEVSVQFCTSEEWEKDLECLIATLQPGETDDNGTGIAESKRLIDASKKRIQAVYGIQIADGSELKTLTRELPQEAKRIFDANSIETKTFDNEKEMQRYLNKLIRGDSRLWPLIKEVRIAGPYECLVGGLELVDLPGLNDPNEARVEVTREYLRTAPFVWVIFPMVRGLTADIQKILHEEKLLRTLVLSGSYGSLSLIGTKADDVDTNMADQLGLPEDCEIKDIIRAYRKQTVNEARKQLEQMVRDLAVKTDDSGTLERMVEMARQVHVHATSASAYNRLNNIGRLRRDYGITENNQTGIPNILEYLSQISKIAGGQFNAETALNRLEQLAGEIAFFFRAKATTPTPDVDRAKEKIQAERESFGTEIWKIQQKSKGDLASFRKRFLEKLDPLFTQSVQGINRVTAAWGGIHWATLKAIVQRDGTFKSPSTGRSYDFNEELVEPLLGQLPVTWEKYFTDDIGGVTKEFALRITGAGKNFCEKVRLIIDLLFNKKDDSMEKQLEWFEDKVSLLVKTANDKILAAVRERRQELAATMPLIAKERMRPAYNDAKQEIGRGMKGRILEKLIATAHISAQPIYSTIQTDLLEGLKDLESNIDGMLRELARTAEEQAQTVAHNANIEIEDVPIDPVIDALLKSIDSIRNNIQPLERVKKEAP
jgi:hypothetical protein